MASQQVPVAQKNFTNEHGLSEHGLTNEAELKGGKEFLGTPESSGEVSQTKGQKVTETSAPAKTEAIGKTEGSLAEESKSFAT
ncbi:hypothetical protein PYCC9005_000297 [Savitreella phatthalungensis]